jgi:predicted acetyltransferase
MNYRFATKNDLDLLAEWNQQLIIDEGHRNRMTVAQTRKRMKAWIKDGNAAVIFEEQGQAVAYALYRELPDEIYLRQFFVARGKRRRGIGKRVMTTLFTQLWPQDRRLVVEVLCKNTAALNFWHAVGYRDYVLTLEIMPDP